MSVAIDQEYELFCQGKLPSPYPFYQRLRIEDPVHWSERLGSWILTRYNDMFSTLRDPRFSSRRTAVFMGQLPEAMQARMGVLREHLVNWLVMTDPPDHTRLRSLVNRAFTPKAIESLKPHIQQIVDDLLKALEGRERFDFIADFAYPLPATVISEMLGVPVEDRDRFRAWTVDVNAFTGGGGPALAGIAEQAQRSVQEAQEYFNDLIARRRGQPGPDLISTLIQTEEQGDRLSGGELVSTLLALLIAGHETTTNLITNGFLALLEHPEQMRKLKQQPELGASAVEEFLRYESPLQRQTRVAGEDLEIGGKQIRKGQPVLAMLGAGNRDPEQYPDPDRLMIDRLDNRHLAFGSGIHFCIGAPLARLEGQIAIRSVLQRFPNLELTGKPLEWRQNMSVRGMVALPVQNNQRN